MLKFLFLIALFGGIFVVYKFFLKDKALSRNPSNRKLLTLPYGKQKYLFSTAEQSFLGVLDGLIGNDGYRIFAKVRLADLIHVKKGMSNSNWQAAFNKISRKHIDFVICACQDLSIVGTIELDDRSHNRSDRKRRDIFINKALESADVPLLRYPAKRQYDVADVREKLIDTFGLEFDGEFKGSGISEIDFDDERKSDSPISELDSNLEESAFNVSVDDPIESEQSKTRFKL